MAETGLKTFSLRNSLLKAAIFRSFDVFPVRPPQFRSQAKISTIRPIFPSFMNMIQHIMSDANTLMLLQYLIKL